MASWLLNLVARPSRTLNLVAPPSWTLNLAALPAVARTLQVGDESQRALVRAVHVVPDPEAVRVGVEQRAREHGDPTGTRTVQQQVPS